jgi:hypothetical protein
VINYQVAGGGVDEDVFVTGTDGNVYDYHWNAAQSEWSWQNLKTPAPGVEVANGTSPAAVTYQGGKLWENVFVTGTDGNLYGISWNGSTTSNGTPVWQNWVNAGNPGTQLASGPTAITYQGGKLWQHVFVIGSNGQLYDYDSNGINPSWVKPPPGAPSAGVTLTSDAAPAVIDYPEAGGAAHLNVLVTGSDGNLHNYYWDGNGWHWGTAGPGNPGVAVTFGAPAGNNPVFDGGVAEDVFVIGTDGNLYVDHWNGSFWSWSQPSPTGF